MPKGWNIIIFLLLKPNINYHHNLSQSVSALNSKHNFKVHQNIVFSITLLKHAYRPPWQRKYRWSYAIFSHGGRRRTWQKTWQSRSAGSRCPYSSCMRHIRQKWAIRCCSVLLWCDGKASTRPHRDASHCSAASISSHHQFYQSFNHGHSVPSYKLNTMHTKWKDKPHCSNFNN